jgi:hypothetical protein
MVAIVFAVEILLGDFNNGCWADGQGVPDTDRDVSKTLVAYPDATQLVD